MSNLFQNLWSEVLQGYIPGAVAQVEGLPREAFDRPNLAGIQEKIASESKLHVAALNSKGISATGRTEKRERTDYGESVTVNVP